MAKRLMYALAAAVMLLGLWTAGSGAYTLYQDYRQAKAVSAWLTAPIGTVKNAQGGDVPINRSAVLQSLIDQALAAARQPRPPTAKPVPPPEGPAQ